MRTGHHAVPDSRRSVRTGHHAVSDSRRLGRRLERTGHHAVPDSPLSGHTVRHAVPDSRRSERTNRQRSLLLRSGNNVHKNIALSVSCRSAAIRCSGYRPPNKTLRNARNIPLHPNNRIRKQCLISSLRSTVLPH